MFLKQLNKKRSNTCLYQHNKDVPWFTYWSCVLAPLSGHFSAAKRAVRYVKTVHRHTFLWDQVGYGLKIFTYIMQQDCTVQWVYNSYVIKSLEKRCINREVMEKKRGWNWRYGAWWRSDLWFRVHVSAAAHTCHHTPHRATRNKRVNAVTSTRRTKTQVNAYISNESLAVVNL